MTVTALRAAAAALIAGVACVGVLAVLPAVVALLVSTTFAVALAGLVVPRRPRGAWPTAVS